MVHDTNVISLFALAVRSHHLFIYRRLTAPESHRTRRLIETSLNSTPKSHPDSIHLLIDNENLLKRNGILFETIEPYPTPPWDTPLGKITDVGLGKDEAVNEVIKQVNVELDQGSVVIFTDGSFLQDKGGGAAIALKEFTESEAFGLTNGISN